jgi:pimeloyl-ACP methyl ester carboxylesterase
LAASAGEEKVYSPAWKTKPSWYIVATQDRVISPDLERFKANLIKATTIELNSSHVPMISQPDRVTDFIIKAARKLSSREAVETSDTKSETITSDVLS